MCEDKSLLEYVRLMIPPVVIAIGANLVRHIREHSDEPFLPMTFLVGVITAGFVGVVACAICKELEVGDWGTSAIVAISGYMAGTLIDHSKTVVDKFFDVFIEILKRKGGGL